MYALVYTKDLCKLQNVTDSQSNKLKSYLYRSTRMMLLLLLTFTTIQLILLTMTISSLTAKKQQLLTYQQKYGEMEKKF